jgi:hypothetical protein
MYNHRNTNTSIRFLGPICRINNLLERVAANEGRSPRVRVSRRRIIIAAATACIFFSGIQSCQAADDSADPSSNMIVTLVRAGALGFGAVGMWLGYKLISNGRNATLFIATSTLCFFAALAVEAAKFFFPNQVFIAVSPRSFPVSLPPPLLMNNETAIVLTQGKGFLLCQPGRTVSFDVQDLVDKYREAQSHFGAAVATNINTQNSDFGPDTEAGRKP